VPRLTLCLTASSVRSRTLAASRMLYLWPNPRRVALPVADVSPLVLMCHIICRGGRRRKGGSVRAQGVVSEIDSITRYVA
jgi:hypothetical protein